MKLLIDFGNSRCKWVNLDDQDLLEVNACVYKSDDPFLRVKEVVEKIDFDSIQETHSVSVLGDVFDKEFSRHTDKKFGLATKFHLSQLKNFGVTLAYENPLNYGADRYAALIAAHNRTSDAKIVIDCGTATTIDAIEANGKHLGGLIIPGIELMCSSLANKASGINMPKQSDSMQLFNDNTAEAVYSGSALVLSHGVRAIVEEMAGAMNQHAAIYVTGGGSHMLDLANSEYVNCPNLVLEGLRIMQG